MTSSALVTGVSYSIARRSRTSFAAIRSLNVHGYDKFYMLQTTKRFDDHKLAYYINMGYPIRADQYDALNGAYVHLNSRTSISLKLHRITLKF